MGKSNRGDLMAFGIDDNDDGFGYEETRINYTENSQEDEVDKWLETHEQQPKHP